MMLMELLSVAAIPKIEVHISNVHTREEFRHTSVTVPVCNGQVVGLGLKGYLYAMEAVVDLAMKKQLPNVYIYYTILEVI